MRWAVGKIVRRVLLALLILVVVLNWTWGRLPKEPPPPAGAKYAQFSDLRIHYQETPGADPPVVMIHGLPGTWGDWDGVADALKGRHTIAIDRPGFAYSTGGYTSFEDQVGAIHQLIGKLKLKDPVIAGHSYGGTLALAYAATFPAQTHAIVLVDAAGNADDISAFAKLQARFVKFLQVPVVRQIADATFSQALRTASVNSGDKEAFDPDPVNEQHKQRTLELNMQTEDLKAYADELINFSTALDRLNPAIPGIKTKAIVIQGDQDKLVSPSVGRQLHQKLKNSTLVMLPGGHMQTYVHPAVVAQQIRAASR